VTVHHEASPSGEDGKAVGLALGAHAAPPATLIRAPAQPWLGPVRTAAEIGAATERLAAGTGPMAVDAERASGYRYSQRAYLVQLRRAGAPTVLIDPIEVGELDGVQRALGRLEWVLHAASQDLPCLRELHLRPARLFDTELAGRLLGMERVSLVTMLETFCGVTLEKGHSAADWSTRPLPAEWLVYAALDVEFLLPLRDAVAARLEREGKTEWATQEFAAELAAPPSPARTDPWRRTSGIHMARSRRQLAGVRALWQARDELASARDVAPGRILPDSAMVAAVRANPATAADLARLPVFRGPRQRRHAARWFAALAHARNLPEAELPTPSGQAEGESYPPTARWREREPDAAERLASIRGTVAELSETYSVQSQNLLAGEIVRRLAWSPPPATPHDVAAAMAALGARPWQIELCAAPVSAALTRAATEAPDMVVPK
jgi:ribonuclease D